MAAVPLTTWRHIPRSSRADEKVHWAAQICARRESRFWSLTKLRQDHTDVRIFMLSRKLSPQALLQTARAHWQIDISSARNRKDNGPANIAVIRRPALDIALSIRARDR